MSIASFGGKANAMFYTGAAGTIAYGAPLIGTHGTRGGAEDFAGKITWQVAGTFSNLAISIVAYDRTAATMYFMIGGVNGNQTLSFSAPGHYEDTSNSDVVAAGNTVQARVETGTGGTTARMSLSGARFTPSGTRAWHIGGTSSVPITETRFWNLCGGHHNSTVTTESAHDLRMRVPGTLSNFGILFDEISTTATITIRLRKNGADANQVLSVLTTDPVGVWYEDTSNTDAVVDGDVVAMRSVWSGVGQLDVGVRGCKVTPTAGDAYEFFSQGRPVITIGTTIYEPVVGVWGTAPDENTTEALSHGRLNQALTLSRLQLRVHGGTMASASTFRLRRNGADGNMTISVPDGTAAWYEDTSNTDTTSAADTLAYAFTAGATGTSITLRAAGMVLAEVAAGGGAEALAAGDLTTAFTIWLATKSGDRNTAMRDALATHYGVGENQDLTTLLTRFLRDRV